MSWNKCVIDATFGPIDECFTFCPVTGDIFNGDFNVITGMSFISKEPPKNMQLVAIWHPDGDDAVHEFYERNVVTLEELKTRVANQNNEIDIPCG